MTHQAKVRFGSSLEYLGFFSYLDKLEPEATEGGHDVFLGCLYSTDVFDPYYEIVK